MFLRAAWPFDENSVMTPAATAAIAIQKKMTFLKIGPSTA